MTLTPAKGLALALPLAGAVAAALAGASPLRAQSGADMAGMAMPAIGVGAQSIFELSRVAPAHSGLDYTEGYITQPAVMVQASAPAAGLSFVGTLDLEGLTLRRGELTPGAWGEGYVDRRHPHTYSHELVASAELRRGWGAASLSAGKGFAPFGTDDPMMRPFVKYPSNHHLSQILERALVIAALRLGPVGLEGGLFNGDEPRRPADFADLGRFGDSWAGRATLRPLPRLELQASHAFVRSPERPDGQGLDQRKWSVSARWGGAGLDSPYALVEWATTRESGPGAPGFRFSSLLAEASALEGPLLLGARLERSTRPEEERLVNPFRSPRPAPDFSIVGVTRFSSATIHARWRAPAALGGRLRTAPFLEAMVSRPADTLPTPLFSARQFYGASNILTLSAGLRVEAGMVHGRMGRYGAGR